MRKYFAVVLLSVLAALGIIYTATPMWVPSTIQATPLKPAAIEAEYDRTTAERIFRRHGCDTRWARQAAEYSRAEGLPVRIVTADIVVESSGRASVISKGGAVGLMQVVPSVWHVSRRRLLNPDENIRVGTHILASNVHRYGTRSGLKRYFGITEGSDASELYATRVLRVAGEK